MHREVLADAEAEADFVGATHSACSFNAAAHAYRFATSHSGAPSP